MGAILFFFIVLICTPLGFWASFGLTVLAVVLVRGL
jgi:hypothetical protein